MSQVACPRCATLNATTQTDAATCTACGLRWTPAATIGSGAAPQDAPTAPFDAQAAHLADTADLPPLAAEDTALIANLRAAYGFDDAGRSPDAPSSGPKVGGGSGDLQHALGVDALPVGGRLGDFEILGEIGRGGMGIVYRARQTSLGRIVALKVLPQHMKRARLAVYRFRTEARAAARLHHSNIVPIYAQGEHEGCYYYAMELIEGVGLDAVIRSRPDLLSSTHARPRDSSTGHALPPPRPPRRRKRPAPPPADDTTVSWTRADYRHVAALFAEVAEALDAAHQAGVIHRDVKPHNLLLSTEDRLHLTDFGLARLTDEPTITVSGEVMGTPAYLSPEQLSGHPDRIDARTDIYSLGVTLYEVLTRRKPFDSASRDQIMHDIVATEPRPPRRLVHDLPLELETICLRAMDKDPQHRHPTAALLAEDLRRFAEGRPILSRRAGPVAKTLKWARRRPGWAAALAASVAVVVLALGLTWSSLATRQRAAQHAVRAAYDRLVFEDLKAKDGPELVAAAARGASAPDVALLHGLLDAGRGQWEAAQKQFGSAAARRPDDEVAAYALAWTRQEGARTADDFAAAKASLAAADALGGPRTPEAWLLRGLALHFDDPEAALTCYQQARDARRAAGGFFPQAILQIARTRNQIMYQTRRIDGFEDARRCYDELIANHYYGVQPYYLASIAYRLVAEVYRGGLGTRADVSAPYYEQALALARQGQAVDPNSDAPVAAEAECLESMGRLDEAIAARTRGLTLAKAPMHKSEHLHYRWRLYYWTDTYDAALADLDALHDFEPDNPFYAHVYPALVLHAAGQPDAARAHARALVEGQPRNAQRVIWAATTLRLLGATDEADHMFAEHGDALDFSAGLVSPQSEAWVQALYHYAAGQGTLDDLLALAAQTEQPFRLAGEAQFHAAARALAAGDRETARQMFGAAVRCYDSQVRYTYHAQVVYQKLEQDPQWPGQPGL